MNFKSNPASNSNWGLVAKFAGVKYVNVSVIISFR